MSENEYYIFMLNNNIVLIYYTSYGTKFHKQQAKENENKEQETEQDQEMKDIAEQLQRAPPIHVNDSVPLYQSPYATQLSGNSITTYISQFKKVYELLTKKS